MPPPKKRLIERLVLGTKSLEKLQGLVWFNQELFLSAERGSAYWHMPHVTLRWLFWERVCLEYGMPQHVAPQCFTDMHLGVLTQALNSVPEAEWNKN